MSINVSLQENHTSPKPGEDGGAACLGKSGRGAGAGSELDSEPPSLSFLTPRLALSEF